MSMGVSKTTVHHWIAASTICAHCNSLKPIMTEENKTNEEELIELVCVAYKNYHDLPYNSVSTKSSSTMGTTTTR